MDARRAWLCSWAATAFWVPGTVGAPTCRRSSSRTRRPSSSFGYSQGGLDGVVLSLGASVYF